MRRASSACLIRELRGHLSRKDQAEVHVQVHETRKKEEAVRPNELGARGSRSLDRADSIVLDDDDGIRNVRAAAEVHDRSAHDRRRRQKGSHVSPFTTVLRNFSMR
jgi:hypothetical protein